MKLRSIFAALIVFTFLFSACDKDKKDPAPTQEPAPAPAANSMTAKVNNADWAAFIPTATIQNGELLLAGSNASRHAIALYTQNDNLTAPGTFSAIATFMEMPQDTTNGPTWMNPAMSVTITKLDLTAKKVSGTFSFSAIAVPGTGASGMKAVTNGVFTDVTIQ